MSKDNVQRKGMPLPGEEPRNVSQAGGGVTGGDLGGSHTGRRTARPGEGDQGNRTPRPRGQDEERKERR